MAQPAPQDLYIRTPESMDISSTYRFPRNFQNITTWSTNNTNRFSLPLRAAVLSSHHGPARKPQHTLPCHPYHFTQQPCSPWKNRHSEARRLHNRSKHVLHYCYEESGIQGSNGWGTALQEWTDVWWNINGTILLVPLSSGLTQNECKTEPTTSTTFP